MIEIEIDSILVDLLRKADVSTIVQRHRAEATERMAIAVLSRVKAGIAGMKDARTARAGLTGLMARTGGAMGVLMVLTGGATDDLIVLTGDAMGVPMDSARMVVQKVFV